MGHQLADGLFNWKQRRILLELLPGATLYSMAMLKQQAPAHPKKLRISIELRVLASMGLAMLLFLLALLFIVYYKVGLLLGDGNARDVVMSLLPLILYILIVCGGLFFSFVHQLVLKPIKKISDEAQAISEGRLDVNISAAQNDEVGDLARSVTRMADTLRHDIESLKDVDKLKSEFIAISSHNLRSPLASVEAGLDMLESTRLNEEARKMVELTRSSVNNLIVFSEDMLTIANIEAKQGDVSRLTPVLFSNVISPLVIDASSEAQKRGIGFTTTLNIESTHVRANLPLLRLAIRHLLDNAFKFTKSGGKVTFSAKQEEGRIILVIADSGIGISDKELPTLFTKFHRGTDTLAYNYEGIGVGLYIAKLILDQHHATITIKSEPNKGTEITVILPSAD